ncbi:DUF4263 domain-containing protein [Cyanobacteria bacterium FACHB-63]|nr:DUF4263 domain-containing protein [Cyanobacteria bacterium FACHB-63]
MRQAKKNTILFLTADPSNASRLRLGQEHRDILEKLQLANLRDHFSLQVRMSVRPSDLAQAIFDTNPQIVHFSGHGTGTGELCFEDQTGKIQTIRPEALASLFELVNANVKSVILNACYSETQAKAIARYIDYVIGMRKEIGDQAAISFAVGFYRALGSGRSLEEAFKFGLVELKLLNIPEHLTPILITRQSTEELPISTPSDHPPIQSAIPHSQQFISLLDSQPSKDTMHSFLAEHSKILQAAFPRTRRILSKPRLGNFALDFAAGFFHATVRNWSWLLIDVERPNDALFTQRGTPSAKLTHAVQQISEWRNWIAEHTVDARTIMPCIESSSSGLIIMGRRRDITEEMAMKLKNFEKSLNNISIHTYDWLADIIKFGMERESWYGPLYSGNNWQCGIGWENVGK